jgi:hypothetical protein
VAYYVGAIDLAADGRPGQAAPMPSLARRYLQIEPDELSEVFKRAIAEYDAAFLLFSDIAEAMPDISTLASRVHNELTEAVDEAILESMVSSEIGRPLVLTLGETSVELVDDGGGEGVAYLLDDSGTRVIAHRFRAERESAVSLLTALGLDDPKAPREKIDEFLNRLAA